IRQDARGRRCAVVLHRPAREPAGRAARRGSQHGREGALTRQHGPLQWQGGAEGTRARAHPHRGPARAHQPCRGGRSLGRGGGGRLLQAGERGRNQPGREAAAARRQAAGPCARRDPHQCAGRPAHRRCRRAARWRGRADCCGARRQRAAGRPTAGVGRRGRLGRCGAAGVGRPLLGAPEHGLGLHSGGHAAGTQVGKLRGLHLSRSGSEAVVGRVLWGVRVLCDGQRETHGGVGGARECAQASGRADERADGACLFSRRPGRDACAAIAL
ncbi:hypothetical protein EMIHUDRAFT_438263, partial [Emiliania huxleyi CCMP1516]|uniref:Uncharacterized protein n=2 Tax=Emiliania huxleyi TaxID=2903 RepID=A0A0D3IBF3_EMIH1